MSEDSTNFVNEGALTVLEAAPGYLFAMGWFRLAEGAEFGPDTALPELVLGPPGEPAQTRPLRRFFTPSGQPQLRKFEVLIRVEAPWSFVEVSLRSSGQICPLTTEPRTPTPFRRRGALEALGRAGIAGWVFDLPGEVPQLLVDGRFVLPLNLNRERRDLPFDDVEAGRPLGFRLTLEALGNALRARDSTFALMDGKSHDIALLLGGREHVHTNILHARSLSGRLERAAVPLAEGWATEADAGPGPVTVDVLLQGVRWQTVKADRPRRDLTANGVGTRVQGGAMRIALPWRNPTRTPNPKFGLRPAHGVGELRDEVTLEEWEAWRPMRGSALDALPEERRPVTIIVPIYNAGDDLAKCIEAVLLHTAGPTRLLLIDDASPEPRVAEVLGRHEGRQGVEVLRNARNLGFTATCNVGLKAAGRDDVVLLNSDTIVGPGWLDGLRLVAAAAVRVGTVTPLSNNAGAFSVPEMGRDNSFAPWFTPEDMARLARQASLSLWPEVPTGHGFCLYITRACLDRIGGLDEIAFPRGYGEENDFCLRAQRAGFRNILDDRTLVWHRQSASFGPERTTLMAQGRTVLEQRYPEYGHLTPMFADDPALLAIRWRVRSEVETSLLAGSTPRSRLLFVISTQSGGTPQTNRDLMDALSDRYEPWLLRCEAGLLELSGPDGELLETLRLDTPIAPATHHSVQYDRAVADMLIRHGIELVHIRHIAWHGIGLPGVCRRLGIPVVFSFHDFYTVCPTIKLLDAQGRFCGGQCTEGEGDCRAELWPSSEIPPLRGRFVHSWRAMMAEALAQCDAFVTTSPSARDTLLSAFPSLHERDLRVIPHGRDLGRMERLAEEPGLDEVLRVLVPGNVSHAKGSALIAEMAALDEGRQVEFHMLGEVDHHLSAPRPGVILHGPYRRGEFAERVRSIRPHMAAILSIWPETWCHTLTESWSVGLPVLTFDLGAQGERVAASKAGWVLASGTPAETVLAWLGTIKREPADFREREHNVLQWQRDTGRHHDTTVMAAAYDLLYRDVQRARRSFPNDPQPGVPCPVVLDLQARARSGLVLPNDRMGLGMLRVPVAASFPFALATHGIADRIEAALGFKPHALLIRAGAVAVHDMPKLVEACHAAGIHVLIDVDEVMVDELMLPDCTEARALFQAKGVSVLGRRPITVWKLDNLNIRAAQAPHPGDSWRTPPGPKPDAPPRSSTVARILLLDGFGHIESPLGKLLQELADLGVVELCNAEAAGVRAGRADPKKRLAAPMLANDLAVLLGPIRMPADDPLLLAAAEQGLPTLVAAENWPSGEANDSHIVLVPPNFDEAARLITELASDVGRRAKLRRAARISCLSRCGNRNHTHAWEVLLAQLM